MPEPSEIAVSLASMYFTYRATIKALATDIDILRRESSKPLVEAVLDYEATPSGTNRAKMIAEARKLKGD